jgi:hypothetical protein
MKLAALYARVTGDVQAKEGTIESQVLALKKQIAASESKSIGIKSVRPDATSLWNCWGEVIGRLPPLDRFSRSQYVPQ